MVSWLTRGVTYCCQAARVTTQVSKTTHIVQQPLFKRLLDPAIVNTGSLQSQLSLIHTQVPLLSRGPPRKFEVKSPYKEPGARRHGYKQEIYDGGRLPRGLSATIKSNKYKKTNTWDSKHALFGQNDYIDILGDGPLRPVDLIQAPLWLKGFNGNELQRLVRQMKYEGHKIKVLYPSLYKSNWKRIKFLYNKYNRKRGYYH